MFVKLALFMLRSKGMELEDMHHFTWVDQRISTHVQSLHNLCIIWDINGLMVQYSSIITLKKLACAITRALHEQQKYRGMFASAREIDDVSTARRVLKNSSRV